ncbi:uncharacterized protein SCHCODRAFT_02504024, partial [Schizophyllum commune H4-8]|uniref:uncharacterized protein n=1 Tax=Schizophyllum commune (strain H4-8 / FGSC 9210) TaxID=578458 RepID=UPI00215E6A35
ASGGEIPEERDQDSDAKTQPNNQTRQRERVTSPGHRCQLCQQLRAREDVVAASSERGT